MLHIYRTCKNYYHYSVIITQIKYNVWPCNTKNIFNIILFRNLDSVVIKKHSHLMYKSKLYIMNSLRYLEQKGEATGLVEFRLSLVDQVALPNHMYFLINIFYGTITLGGSLYLNKFIGSLSAVDPL